MFYKLLGMVVWHGGKLILRERYGSSSVLKPVLAGVTVAVAGGVALAIAARRNGSDG